MHLLHTAAIAVTIAASATAPVDMDSPRFAATCQEDEPCWDCTTMGDRICGPVEGCHWSGDRWVYPDGSDGPIAGSDGMPGCGDGHIASAGVSRFGTLTYQCVEVRHA